MPQKVLLLLKQNLSCDTLLNILTVIPFMPGIDVISLLPHVWSLAQLPCLVDVKRSTVYLVAGNTCLQRIPGKSWISVLMKVPMFW